MSYIQFTATKASYQSLNVTDTHSLNPFCEFSIKLHLLQGMSCPIAYVYCHLVCFSYLPRTTRILNYRHYDDRAIINNYTTTITTTTNNNDSNDTTIKWNILCIKVSFEERFRPTEVGRVLGTTLHSLVRKARHIFSYTQEGNVCVVVLVGLCEQISIHHNLISISSQPSCLLL